MSQLQVKAITIEEKSQKLINPTERKLWIYTEKYFQESDCTRFPTLREVKENTRVSFKKIIEACEDSAYLMITGVNVEHDIVGDLYLETFEV